jgi:malate/lactate dehydrogenase
MPSVARSWSLESRRALAELERAIGAGGVERIVEIALSDEAQANFTVSVDAVKELLAACKTIDPSLA